MGNHWLRAALCRRFSHLPWVIDPGRVTRAQEEAMRTVCAACPVQRDCADFVRREKVTAGFWAGKQRASDRPRRKTGDAA